MRTTSFSSLRTLLGRSLSRRLMLGYAAGSAFATAGASFVNHASAAMTQVRRAAGGSPPANGMARGSSLAVEAPYDGELPKRLTTSLSSRDISIQQNVRHVRMSLGGTGRVAGVRDLTALPGVAMAVAWADDGSLVDVIATSDIPREVAVDAARYGAALSAMAPGLAGAYSRETGFTWAPFHTLVLRGGDWTAVVGSQNTGIWVKSADADLNHLVTFVNGAAMPT